MGPIEQAVVDHFAESGIHYSRPDSQSVFLAPFTLRSGNVMLVCDCRETAKCLIVSAVFPFNAPAERMAAVAEFITRVNYHLAIGAFMMDCHDGECAFRCGIDVEGDWLTPALVRRLVGCCLATTDHFYTGLAAVALGGLPPTEALTMIDQDTGRTFVSHEYIARHGLTVDPCDRLN